MRPLNLFCIYFLGQVGWKWSKHCWIGFFILKLLDRNVRFLQIMAFPIKELQSKTNVRKFQTEPCAIYYKVFIKSAIYQSCFDAIYRHVLFGWGWSLYTHAYTLRDHTKGIFWAKICKHCVVLCIFIDVCCWSLDDWWHHHTVYHVPIGLSEQRHFCLVKTGINVCRTRDKFIITKFFLTFWDCFVECVSGTLLCKAEN